MYGAEHLLRLCYKLPEIMTVNDMSAEEKLQMEMRLASVVSFIQKNEALFFRAKIAEEDVGTKE